MDYTIIPQDNYHGEVKLGKEKRRIRCYSPEQMKKMHPNDDYNLAGETLSNNKAEKIAQLAVGDENYIVSNPGSHNKLLYKVSGYVTVDGEVYVAILTSRLPFLLILLAMVAGIAAAGTVTVSMLLAPPIPEEEPLNPVPQIDPLVEPIENDNYEQVKSEKGGGFISMTYTLNATLHLSDGTIDITYKNPGKSNQNVVLELYIISEDTEVLIARSGLIAPGYELNKLTFIEDSAILQTGTYNGKYMAIYYNNETGEKAMVESKITDVKITVTD